MAQNITFNYVAGDSSNDFGNGTAVIDIFDGDAGLVVDGTTTSSEGDVSDGVQTVVGQFTVSAGSDNPDSASIVFNTNTLVQLNALGLTTEMKSTL